MKNLLIILLVIVIAGAAIYFLYPRSQSPSVGNLPSASTSSITSNQNPSSNPTSTATQISPEGFVQNLLTKSTSGLNLAPAFQLASTETTGRPPSYDSVKYGWDNLGFTFQGNNLTATLMGDSLLTNQKIWLYNDYPTGFYTFSYNNQNYFLFKGEACGNVCHDLELSLYRFSGNALTQISPSSTKPVLTGDIDNGDFVLGEVITSSSNGYLIINQGSTRTAIILDSNGNYVGTATASSKSVPSEIRQILQTPLG